MKTDINGELYSPIIITDLPSAFISQIIVTDGSTIRKNDVLVSHFHTKLLVCNVERLEDLFEDFWILDVQLLNNIGSFGVHGTFEIGDELKILASAVEWSIKNAPNVLSHRV
jgi:hypothetical protein